MGIGAKKSLLVVVFVGILVGPMLYRKWTAEPVLPPTQSTTQKGDELLSRYGFYLDEVAAKSGVDFVHHPCPVDEKVAHIEPQISATGASVSVVDFDRDGWQDFYVTSSSFDSVNRLYHNQKNNTFVDVAEKVGLDIGNSNEAGASMGSVWADIDNDGFEDVLIYRWGASELYRNVDGKSFERVKDSGLPKWANIGGATWLDYDRDGAVDLFLAGYWSDEVCICNLKDTRIMPESFEYANNGGSKWLLRNRGDGTFEDVSAKSGISSKRWTLAVVAADFNNDAFTDIFLANDYGVSQLFLNEQGKSFREVGKESGIGQAPKSGMNAAIGDVFNDGRLAIYVSNISEEGVLIQGNNLWVPKKSSPEGILQFENLASPMGVELGGWSFGAQFGDLNNDSNLDIYLTNGYVSGNKGTSYWYDFAEITGGHSQIISEAKNWPAMRGRSLAGYQNKRVWLNDGAGKFREVAQQIGVNDRYDGRAIALADLDNNGSLDVLVANQRGPFLIYQNHVDPKRHWLDLEIEGAASNRSAIGAQVTAKFGDKIQKQELVAANGFSSQNQRRIHFGLGALDHVDSVEIRWPSGKTQVLKDLPIDKLHTVREEQ